MAISDTIRKGILSFKTSENEYTKFLPKTLANLVTTTSGTDVESKINELDDNIGDLDTITETDEDEIITKTYTTGFLSKLIDDVRTTVFNVTHAKAVWWNKLENKTVYDKIDGDCLQYENVVSDLDDMSAITEENAGKFVADARAVAELNSKISTTNNALKTLMDVKAKSTDNAPLITDTDSFLWRAASDFPCGSINIPTYTTGIYITNGGSDGILMGVDYSNNFYFGFRNGSTWGCRKI